jgi:hypothetical protein
MKNLDWDPYVVEEEFLDGKEGLELASYVGNRDLPTVDWRRTVLYSFGMIVVVVGG